MTALTRVLLTFSFNDPNDLNPYGRLLVASLPAGVEPLPFSWKTALLGRYSVLHVHWPEYLYRAPSRKLQPIKAVLCWLLIARIMLTRIAVVRTVHNDKAHIAGGRGEEAFLRAFNRLTTLEIVMGAHQLPSRRFPAVYIPHGHYRSWFPAGASDSVVSGRLLLFGLLRPYKGVEELIAAFRRLPAGSPASLQIAGSPQSPEYRDEIVELAGGDPRIQLELSRVPDDALAVAISSAQAVVLPYRYLGNSGSALLALSLNRPVLLPDSPTARELQAEFGEPAVTIFTDEIDESDLASMLEITGGIDWSTFTVDMSQRDWDRLGQSTAEAYATAIRSRRGA